MVMMTWIIQTFVASILYLTTFVKSANIFRVTNRPLKVITWVRLDETVQCNLEKFASSDTKLLLLVAPGRLYV